VTSYFSLTVQTLPASTEPTTYELAYFPLPDELSVSYLQADGAAGVATTPALTREYLDHVGLGHLLSEDDPSIGARLLVEYAQLIIKSALPEVAAQFSDDAESRSAGSLMDALVGKLDNAAGLAARFLLHGTRLPAAAGTAELQPLYELTGQRFEVTGTTAASATLTVSRTGTDVWNVTFPGGGTSLNLPSAPGSIFLSPADIAGSLELDFDAGQVSAGEIDIAHTDVRRFPLTASTAWAAADAAGAPPAAGRLLWRLPRDLRETVTAGGGAAAFALHQATANGSHVVDPASDSPLDPATYAWVVSVDFSVRRIPAASAGAYLATVYELAGVDAAALQRLASTPRPSRPPVARRRPAPARRSRAPRRPTPAFSINSPSAATPRPPRPSTSPAPCSSRPRRRTGPKRPASRSIPCPSARTPRPSTPISAPSRRREAGPESRCPCSRISW
jgi:hypothetical protein